MCVFYLENCHLNHLNGHLEIITYAGWSTVDTWANTQRMVIFDITSQRHRVNVYYWRNSPLNGKSGLSEKHFDAWLPLLRSKAHSIVHSLSTFRLSHTQTLSSTKGRGKPAHMGTLLKWISPYRCWCAARVCVHVNSHALFIFEWQMNRH